MQTCGVKPDRITCSILLKSIQKNCNAEIVSRILTLLDNMDGEADEVFLNSFIEACIRVGRSDLLTGHLQKQRLSKKSSVEEFTRLCKSYPCLWICRRYC